MKEEKLAQQAIRHKNLLADLEAEEPAWINSSNIDEKITEALFEKKFSSTGLAIPESKNWRYQALTFHWNREYSKDVEEMIADHVAKGNAGFIASQEDLSKRLMVEQLLRPMISTGKNRSEYGSLVDDFVNTISKVGGISDQKIIDPTTFMVREGKVVPAEERLEETPGDEGEFEPRPSSDELRQWFHEDFGSEMATDVPESQKGDQRKKQQQQQQAGKGKAKGKGKK